MTQEPQSIVPTVAQLQRQIRDLEQRVRQGEKSLVSILSLAGLDDVIPPDELRLHVGTNMSAVNFYAQGIASARKTTEIFGRSPGGPVLDWGCGSGRTYNWLRLLPAWQQNYHGCDVDPAAIEWLTRKMVQRVKICDPQPPLPYLENSFTGLFSYSVLTHIHADHHDAWYAEIARVLQPGGKAFITIQGDTLIRLGRIQNEKQLAEFNSQGWTHIGNEGHYKDAALVSMAWSKSRLSRHFKTITPMPEGYNNMDAFVVEK